MTGNAQELCPARAAVYTRNSHFKFFT